MIILYIDDDYAWNQKLNFLILKFKWNEMTKVEK